MENSRKFSIGAAIATLLFTIIIVMAGFNIGQQFAVARPLQAVIENVPGVEKASIDRKDGVTRATVTLGRVGNLKQCYRSLTENIEDSRGKKPIEIIIAGPSTPALEKQYRKLELTIYQCLAQNAFVELEQKGKAQVREQGMEFLLQVDEDNLYITLVQDENRLFKVIGRTRYDLPVAERRQ